MDNSTMFIAPPGNDTQGGGCIVGALPDFRTLDLPDDKSVFIGGLNEGSVYDKAGWKRCCKGDVNFARSCFPWCEIPDHYLENGQDETEAGASMRNCIGFIRLYGAVLNDGHKAGVGLAGWAVVSLVLASMALN